MSTGLLDQAMDYLADKNAAPVLVESISTFYFYKQGDVVIVEGGSGKLNPRSEFLLLGTLQHASLYPEHDVIAPMTWGARASLNGLIKVTTNGNVYVYIEQTSSAVEAWCNFSYFAA